MTAVGKILVFMVLLFSVATSAFIVVVFSTRTNWKTYADRNRELAVISAAAYKAELAKNSTIKETTDKRARELEAKVEELAKAKADVDSQLSKVNDDKVAEQAKYKAIQDTQALNAAEISRLKQERGVFTDRENNFLAKLSDQLKDLNAQKLLTAQAENKAREAERRRDQVLRELERTTQELASAKDSSAQDSSGTRSVLKPPAPIAPKNVRGEVTIVGTNGLAQISLGSDSGLQAGNELFILRIDLANTANSQYLGTLKLSRVDPKAAVGQFTPVSSKDTLKAGDQVWSSLSGK